MRHRETERERESSSDKKENWNPWRWWRYWLSKNVYVFVMSSYSTRWVLQISSFCDLWSWNLQVLSSSIDFCVLEEHKKSCPWEPANWVFIFTSMLLRFNVLFYNIYWKYLWIFGYLISARFHGCEVSHVAILVCRSCG